MLHLDTVFRWKFSGLQVYDVSREGHSEVSIAQATQGSLGTVCDREMSGAGA